ncbi:hypothetical protein V22_28800 [Calycomorphotria hydatis]|uniref:Chaperone protein DnaJ n=1 Tax=Calycomorphotria hydatis TaxID=2528027 RepID=A0A517TB71_9PLAN|nr:hypothetical protein V22_28800 [Calycomorphotria hydatis]
MIVEAIIDEHGNWTVTTEGYRELCFSGMSPVHAFSRLLEAIQPDGWELGPWTQVTESDRVLFISGRECPDCGGSGEVTLLTSVSPCDTCGGTGRIARNKP